MLIGSGSQRTRCPANRILALDLPTSWIMTAPSADDFTPRMFAAIYAMLLDVLAAVAQRLRDRRRRQAQGIEKAKAAGNFRGRPEDTDRNNGIAAMLRKGVS